MKTNKLSRLSLSALLGTMIFGLSILSAFTLAYSAPAGSKASQTRTLPVKALQQAVDASDVRVINAVELLPPAIRARFREKTEAMGNGNGKPTKTSIIDMANPGKSWNAGCTRGPGLASRQLQFAGIASDKCFVVFNTGGIASRQWVALFDLSRETAPLLGAASATPRCTDLAGLRKTVRSEAFRKAPSSMTISL